MCDHGRGLYGRTVAGTGGKRRAAGRNKRLGRRQGRALRGARVQVRPGRRTGGQTGKPTAKSSQNRARNSNRAAIRGSILQYKVSVPETGGVSRSLDSDAGAIK